MDLLRPFRKIETTRRYINIQLSSRLQSKPRTTLNLIFVLVNSFVQSIVVIEVNKNWFV